MTIRKKSCIVYLWKKPIFCPWKKLAVLSGFFWNHWSFLFWRENLFGRQTSENRGRSKAKKWAFAWPLLFLSYHWCLVGGRVCALCSNKEAKIGLWGSMHRFPLLNVLLWVIGSNHLSCLPKAYENIYRGCIEELWKEKRGMVHKNVFFCGYNFLILKSRTGHQENYCITFHPVTWLI